MTFDPNDPRLLEVERDARKRVADAGHPADVAFEWMRNEHWEKVNSPIEALFFVALAAVVTSTSKEPHGLVVDVRFGPYRVDCALVAYEFTADDAGSLDEFAVGIELDGHEFHERTPDQAQRDKSRDRQLFRDYGVPVIRFTGSEVYRDPFACAEDAYKAFNNYLTRVQKLISARVEKGRDGPD